MEGKYRLTAGPPLTGDQDRFIGMLVCNDHDHAAFDEAQDCILLSLQTGRPVVIEEENDGTDRA